MPLYAYSSSTGPVHTQLMSDVLMIEPCNASFALPNVYDNGLFKTIQRIRPPASKGAEEYRRAAVQSNSNAAAFAANANIGPLSIQQLALPPLQQPSLDGAPTICVVGCGFVGESLLRLFSTAFPTIGYDISTSRLAQLNTVLTQNRTPSEWRLTLTTTPSALRQATHILISVPTLLKNNRTCDTSYVRAALHTILMHARPGTTIVIESSVGVGTTRQLLGPHRQRFHCGMSPERVDPGRVSPAPRSIPKIVSGLGDKACDRIADVYSRVYDNVVKVSSCEVAEMTKLHENCFRMVNIAYANEMADACRALKLDPTEVISAASTKPYGFMPFYPGLGVGGHCIPVNPHYLMESRKPGQFPILERATKAMSKRPDRLAKAFWRKVMLDVSARERRASEQQGVPYPTTSIITTSALPRILVVGLGFKSGESILDFSPSIAFAKVIKEIGCARLAFYDPLVAQDKIIWMEKLDTAHWRGDVLRTSFDGVALCMRQKGVEWSALDAAERSGLCVRRFVDA